MTGQSPHRAMHDTLHPPRSRHPARARAQSALAASVLALATLAMTTNARAETAIDRGKTAAAVCVACHQADGNGLSGESGHWPRLAGLNADYLATQIGLFRSGERQSAEMQPFAQMLTEDQITDVAAYYASLPAKAPEPDAAIDPALLEQGRTLALRGDWNHYIVPCMKCHGPDNQGVGSHFPGIAGQHAAYLATQLHAWQQGTRSGDPQALMHTVAAHLDDQQIEAVSAWLSTQPPQTETAGRSAQ